ncbi:HEAT repeat-containing protein [Quadrisphaera granulorum]|uniref:HEAT repeat protein n=1 Tax=Quadrisphaera granulorum TaxID=317664 RepID=A0A316A6V8_9ACTN|nr:HEAT repeat protein [Quadrisphaera granulorum]SZE97101.1 HEAT repeat-containing protein [Quadrisphaera granulorum]
MAGLPADLLEAREGTGATFPATLAAYARRPRALDQAATWWSSPDPVTRLVGLELSAVLAGPASPLPLDERERARHQVAAHASEASTGDDADLRWAAAKALGAAGPSAAALDVLTILIGDDDPDVRWQAVACLPLALGSDPGIVQGDPGRRAVETLVSATADSDDDVVEQAVFALAEQLEPDGVAATPAVADALVRRLDSPGETGGLAALGLARRDDPRAEPAVRAALEKTLADPEFELDEPWLSAADLLPGLATLAADVRRAGATLGDS